MNLIYDSGISLGCLIFFLYVMFYILSFLFLKTIFWMQILDLTVIKPQDFCLYGLGCLEKLADLGDDCAKFVRESLRIVVC